MGYLVVLVVYHFIIGDTKADRGPIRVIHWAGAVPTLSSFPVIVFAFTCHQNVRASFPPSYGCADAN
jgi:amino acid permease